MADFGTRAIGSWPYDQHIQQWRKGLPASWAQRLYLLKPGRGPKMQEGFARLWNWARERMVLGGSARPCYPGPNVVIPYQCTRLIIVDGNSFCVLESWPPTREAQGKPGYQRMLVSREPDQVTLGLCFDSLPMQFRGRRGKDRVALSCETLTAGHPCPPIARGGNRSA